MSILKPEIQIFKTLCAAFVEKTMLVLDYWTVAAPRIFFHISLEQTLVRTTKVQHIKISLRSGCSHRLKI